MIGVGFFFGGDTVEGSIQNVENYGIINKYEVLIAGAQIHIIWSLLFCPNLENTRNEVWTDK